MAEIEETKKKIKRGKPEYIPTEKDLGIIQSYSALGYSLDIAAAEIGTSPRTLKKALTKFPNLKQARNVGKAKAQKRAISCVYERAFPVYKDGPLKGQPKEKGSDVLAIFWMKTQYHWREREIVEHTGSVSTEAPIINFVVKEKPKPVSAEEKEKLDKEKKIVLTKSKMNAKKKKK